MNDNPHTRFLRVTGQHKLYYRAVLRHVPVLKGVLSNGKRKIGPPDEVRAFNLPLSVCSDNGIASLACRACCYAHDLTKGNFECVGTRASNNLSLIARDDFAELMIGAILDCGGRFFKIHIFGEFFSVAYIESWVRICKELPHVTFWTYTRAWRKTALVQPLSELSRLPNIQVLLSFDEDTGVPQVEIPDAKLAYLATRDGETPSVPCCVVFRAAKDRDHVPMTSSGGSLVCPHEDGTTVAVRPCIECGICLPRLSIDRCRQASR